MINKSDYLVLDVETNGLNSQKDDLLSLSIYDPDSGEMYNKFFPLQLDDDVYTTEYNGLTKESLQGATHLTQDELDSIIKKFKIENRIVLIYGDLDKPFLNAYLKRRNLVGFNHFDFYNFKQLIYSSSYNPEQNVTKDNLCKIFNIEGIEKTHSGINDCILEWKLFEKINNNPLIVINNDVYRFNDKYIVPASYLNHHKRLTRSLAHLPQLACKTHPIKSIPLFCDLKKFEGNVSGVAIEAKMRSFFEAHKVNSQEFLYQNINTMDFLGTLPSKTQLVPVITKKDGSLLAINESDKELIKEINNASEQFLNSSKELLSYIKSEVFKSEPVYSQELIVNKQDNILAKCDLSNKHGVVEIKTGYNINVNNFKYQLFYQSNNRPVYLLNINWLKKSLNLSKIEFIFNEEAEAEMKAIKKEQLDSKAEELQLRYFNNKNIEIIDFKGISSHSKFICKICNNTFIMKQNLTYIFILYLNCPYCFPSRKPNRYEKLSEKDYDYYDLIKGKLGRKRIDIYNWITKNEIHLQCRKCNNIWIENIKSLENCRCPICLSKKAKRTNY